MAASPFVEVVNAIADPFSVQPELMCTPVRGRPFVAAWHGFALVAVRPSGLATAYWAVAPVKGGGWRIELADTAVPEDWDIFAGELLGGTGTADGDMLAYHDGDRKSTRLNSSH